MKNKFLAFVMVMAMALTMIPGVALAAEHTVTDVSGINYAINNDTDGDIVIILGNNVTIGEKLTVPASKNVTIKGAYTITRDAAYTGTLFEVAAGATLTLDDGLVIDGGNEWTFNKTGFDTALANSTEHEGLAFVTSASGAPNATAAMFVINGSVLANDVTIQNNYSTKSSNSGDGGIFKVNANAILTMTGAKVKHVATAGANAVAYVASGATWTINDGTVISDNYAGRNGGICRTDSGKIVMNGGSIVDNHAVNTNGTVFMMYGPNSLFEMKGGTISGNLGANGPANGRNSAIYLHSDGKMIMTGGTISNNRGTSFGGIDTNKESSVLEISGGYVGDNISIHGNANKDINDRLYRENGVDYYKTDGYKITGGVFTQDVSKWLGEGVEQPIKGDDGKYYVGDDMKDAPVAPAPAPKSSGSGISVTYNGGNSFSTSKSDVPTGVEIDGVAVPFSGDGRNFTVGCVDPGAKWVTVRWNSTSVTTNFTPDGLVECSVSIPKTGDMPVWAAVLALFGF